MEEAKTVPLEKSVSVSLNDTADGISASFARPAGIRSEMVSVIVALAREPIKAVYVLVVYTAIQVLESYLITPLIEQQTTSVPAALLITVQIIMALAGGILGILVATPLAVAGMVAIRMLYVEDVLHDRLQ